MSYENENVSMIFMEYEEEIAKAIKHYESELSSVRAGRANPHVLDRIMVEYYGVVIFLPVVTWYPVAVTVAVRFPYSSVTSTR